MVTRVIEAVPASYILAFTLLCHHALIIVKGSLEKQKKLAILYKRTVSYRHDYSALYIKLPDLFKRIYSDDTITYHIRNISFAFDDDILKVNIIEATRSTISKLHFSLVN